MVAAGVDVRTVAGRMGNPDPSMTLRVYSHRRAQRDREAAAILGKTLPSLSTGGRRTNRVRGCQQLHSNHTKRDPLEADMTGWRAGHVSARETLTNTTKSAGQVTRSAAYGSTR